MLSRSLLFLLVLVLVLPFSWMERTAEPVNSAWVPNATGPDGKGAATAIRRSPSVPAWRLKKISSGHGDASRCIRVQRGGIVIDHDKNSGLTRSVDSANLDARRNRVKSRILGNFMSWISDITGAISPNLQQMTLD